MQQEINLYALLPKRTGMYLTKKTVLGSYLILLFFLLFIYAYQIWDKHNLSNVFIDLNKKVDILNQNLQQLTIKYPISDPTNLIGSVKSSHEELENKLSIIKELSPNIHLAESLMGLANAIVPGVWLTEIQIDRHNYVSLRGHLLQIILLKEFLNQLAKQPIFQNLNFSLEEITDTTVPADFYIIGQTKDGL